MSKLMVPKIHTSQLKEVTKQNQNCRSNNQHSMMIISEILLRILLQNTIAKDYCKILLQNTIASYYYKILLQNTLRFSSFKLLGLFDTLYY